MVEYNGAFIENFLSDEECNYFLSFVNEEDLWNFSEQHSDYWNGRVMYPQMLEKRGDSRALELKEKLQEVELRVNDAIVKNYNLANRVYADGIGIVRWPAGIEQPPHADNANNDGSSNGLNWRDYGTIIYLNDNFTGGETYYPDYNIFVKPKKGALAIHPGGVDHLHGVTKVEGNTRYTIASFWSNSLEHWDGV